MTDVTAAPHLASVRLCPERYPTRAHYPFALPRFQEALTLAFPSAVTLFVGENGSGKSTLLEAIARRCGAPIWEYEARGRVEHNPYEQLLSNALDVQWTRGPVPASLFAAQIFREFTTLLEDCAAADPGQLRYFGGASLMTQSHGQSLLSFFRARYVRRGLYLLDEPETALSPHSQLALLHLLREMSAAGHAQFIVCTHSPILLACPDAAIYSFDATPIAPIRYEDTDHYRLYKAFMADPPAFVKR